MIARNVYNKLIEWKKDQWKKPLIFRGARQVGKTYLIREFGKREYPEFTEINFERNPEYKEFFKELNPVEIINKISLYTGRKINTPGHLLFLDEIQECPEAIMSLRYFYEECPEVNIISAGSLLEFILESEDFKMPVGRVQFLYLYPLSFGEFLEAVDGQGKRKYLEDRENLEKIPEAVHNKLNEYIRKYFIIGGMPGVLQEYLRSGDVLRCQKLQRSIIETYLDDFAKYSKNSQHKYLKKVFHSVPGMTGRKYVYANVDSAVKSRELKSALETLEMAGVVKKVTRVTGPGYPFENHADEKYFKVIFLDIGLFHAILNIYPETVSASDLSSVFRGAAAEQFVGQELIANADSEIRSSLYYWARDAKGSMAEIDYLYSIKNKIVPVEVKSGSNGHLKSLQLFMNKYSVEKGIKIAQIRYSDDGRIISFPFYEIENLDNFLN